MLGKQDDGYTPTLRDMKYVMGTNILQSKQCGRRLEYFMVDLLMSCKEGKRFGKSDEEAINRLFFRRSGPIAAAVAFTIEAPDDAELPE